ncbi:hypothetical protein P308_32870 [Pseudomonas piscis]|nr:hypothetical protein P308_32870 [Pseudomonas piscis]
MHIIRVALYPPGHIGLDDDPQAITVPTSCKPLEVVRRRRSTGIAASKGAGQRQFSPGSSRTRAGLPKRVITVASPERTCTRLAAARANATSDAAQPMRRQGKGPSCAGAPW